MNWLFFVIILAGLILSSPLFWCLIAFFALGLFIGYRIARRYYLQILELQYANARRRTKRTS